MDSLVWTFLFLGLALGIAVLELFVPSGGILAVLSLGFLITSVVFAFQVDPVFGSIFLLILCVVVPILALFALRIWQYTWIGHRLLLQPEDDPALAPNEELESLKQLIGKQGFARSKMLLGGLIEVEGRRLNAVSESELIEPGDAVKIVRVDGISILVRKTTDIPSATADIADPFV